MEKTYYTRKSARMAIRKAGLEAMNVRYDVIGAVVKPVVICVLRCDVIEVNRRGFAAELVGMEDAA